MENSITNKVNTDNNLTATPSLDDIRLESVNADPEQGRYNAGIRIVGEELCRVSVSSGDAEANNILAEEICERFNNYRGAFDEGWWNCLVSFGNEILSKTTDTTSIQNVMKEAGVERAEIDNLLADSMYEDVICDRLKECLTEYAKTL